MPDTIEQLVIKPELPALVELFELDCTNIPAINAVYYMTPVADNTNPATKVTFGLQDYDPVPIAIEGIEQSSEGAPARPVVYVSNINKFFGALAFLHEDLIGCSVTYIRTFSIYLNTASKISAPPLKYFIAKKLSHTSAGLSWEIRSPLDKERAFLPSRQMLKKDFPGLGINKQIR